MIPAKDLFVRSYADARAKGVEPIVKDQSRIRMADVTLQRIQKNSFVSGQLSPILLEVDAWAARPAILIGSGPSLAHHHQMLQRVSTDVCLVAVDTALPALHDQNIVPHYTGVIEMQARQLKLWFACRSHFKETTLIVPNYIDQVIYQTWDGPVRMFNVWGTARENELQEQWCHDLGLVNNIRTIATSLLYFTVAILGCDPIVLIGHDCGFRSGGPYYAGPVPEEFQPGLKDLADEDTFGRPLLAADGKPTKTSRSLWLNKIELDQMGRDLLHLDPSRRLWNLDAASLLDTDVWHQRTWTDVARASQESNTQTIEWAKEN